MRRFAAVIGVGFVAVAIAAVPAPGASPQGNQFRDVGTDVDPDFCGTGKQVNIAFNVLINEWLAPHQGDYRATVTGKVTFTNPLNGKVVIQRFANQILDVTVSGDPAGIHVHEMTVKGLPELFKTPRGGVLTRDAGYLVFRDVFDGETPISSEVIVNKGPHPQADSNFELFCQIMPGALGL